MTGVLATLAATSGLLAGSLGPLDWMESYGKALDNTKLASRPLLVVIESATDYHETEAPASFYRPGGPADLLRHYTLCRVDADTEYGRQVMEAFKATGLPYTAIIDRQGASILYRREGQLDASQLVSTLYLYKRGTKPTPAESQEAKQAIAKLSDGLLDDSTLALTPVSVTTREGLPTATATPAVTVPTQSVVPPTVAAPAKSNCFT